MQRKEEATQLGKDTGQLDLVERERQERRQRLKEVLAKQRALGHFEASMELGDMGGAGGTGGRGGRGAVDAVATAQAAATSAAVATAGTHRRPRRRARRRCVLLPRGACSAVRGCAAWWCNLGAAF